MAEEEDPGKGLDAQELVFVEQVVGGKSYADAYLAAYDADGYAKASLYVKASRKASEPHIQLAIAQVRAIGLVKTGLRHGDLLERRIAEELAFHATCVAKESFGAAGASYDRINKLMGLYVEKVEDVTKHDPESTLKQIAMVSPEIAARLAEQHNIPWQEPGVTQH